MDSWSIDGTLAEAAATAVRHSLGWAALSTLLVMIPGVPLAYLLARKRFWGHALVSALVGLPLVLPPTAVGFLLLRILSDNGVLGREALGFDPGLLFTWKAVVLACGVMSMPLVIRTARVGFESVDPSLEMLARTLGYGRLRTFWSVTLPMTRRPLLAAALLGFTRAVGEFGASIMVAGNIPGRTQTLAAAIYSAQQSGNDPLAMILLGVALAIGTATVLLAEFLSRPASRDSSRTTEAHR